MMILKMERILFAAIFILNANCARDPEYFPKENWRSSKPEAQGLDSKKISDMIRVLRDNDKVHSVVIIRNGFIVTEKYFEEYDRDTKENLVSVTDSVVSLLTGVAIEKGKFDNTKQKIDSFFDLKKYSNSSLKKNEITIEKLLTMTSGIDWKWRLDPANTSHMILSGDSMRYVLDFPIEENLPERYNYCSANYQIISGLLTKACGENISAFSDKNLFSLIGIKNYVWLADSKGVNWGSFGLYLRPVDLAKIGYLILKKGKWKDKQIVSSRWIEESLKPRVKCNYFPDDTASYGYGWWTEPFGFSAKGWAGNYLFVLPDYDMVIVVTGETRYFVFDQFSKQPVSFWGELRDGPTKSYVAEVVSTMLLPGISKK
ncbi:MAG TPA: serine hydrolase [Spirochaetota bacterium]|nr:serine hydrolase [Spirochaetota bacterium]HOH36732.1 serine hydrolase [Spirochaetota bacterium]HPJ13974.1 serine hydrolase [Spirochaetota bacterium]HPW51233.1 serine hydrolase [Spirochaetota bacterium]HPY04304.1 serine hydrolase [Spirochaetota bacterium]